MPFQKTNNEVMIRSFPSIREDALLKEAYSAIMQNLAGPPHTPGLVVLDNTGKYAGLLTVDDFMKELARLYRDTCDKPDRKQWFEGFFNQCEIMGFKKVAEIMSGKHLSIGGESSFEKACELILSKNAHMLVVVDENAKPVGIITRRQVLAEIAPRMFK